MMPQQSPARLLQYGYDNTTYPPRHPSRLSRNSRSLSDPVNNNFRKPQRTWSAQQPQGRTYTFDETIAKLYAAMKEITEHLQPLSEQFATETAGIKTYATPGMVDELWEMRLDIGSPKSSRTKQRKPEGEEGDDTATLSDILTQNKKARYAWNRAEKAMQIAAHGTKATISPARRKMKIAENKEGIERAIPKLQTLGSQCLELLVKSRKKFSVVGVLMKELEFLGSVMEEWKEFAEAMPGGMAEGDEGWEGEGEY